MIARNTAFTYKGKAVDAKQVGRELGVRYVLEGSVRRSGDQVRINVQLVDAETGAHLWAERFDRDTRRAARHGERDHRPHRPRGPRPARQPPKPAARPTIPTPANTSCAAARRW